MRNRVTPLLATAMMLLAPLTHSQTATCKTPQELEAAVRTALLAQDTNTFWRLHCWTNVSSRDEAMHRTAAFNANFKQLPGDDVTYSSFRIKTADPGINTPRPAGTRGLIQYNIPVTGVILFTMKGSSPSQFGGKPIRFSNDNGLYFGKGGDGNFWLSVEIFVPQAKPAPSH
jgi:hypothetical protein